MGTQAPAESETEAKPKRKRTRKRKKKAATEPAAATTNLAEPQEISGSGEIRLQ
jgi:hypothetical protein